MNLAKLWTWFRGNKPTGHAGPLQKRERGDESWRPGGDFTLRRFDAAKTNRLNRSHWVFASSQSINNDLASDLETLQARCAHESANNPIFDGMVRTYAMHVAGRDGPLLQVRSENEAFNERIEKLWRDVFAMPDPAGRLAGAENVKLWVRMILTAGSFVNIFSNVRRDGPVSFGWKTLHPRRMVTPNKFAGDARVAFGIRTDEQGRPLEYYLDKPQQIGGTMVSGVDFERYPAEIVQHGFIPIEPEQITGFPMLTSALDDAADLRDYDKIVMEAAKNAAAHALGLESASPEHALDPDPMPDSYAVEAGQVNVAPMGWKWAALAATQPAAQYVEFRHERLGAMGRPIHMPLLMVLLSTGDANFAAAQFEGSLYHDGIRELQSYLERAILNQLVEQVILEAVIAGDVQRPEEYELAWTWNVPPHANIEKVVKALRMLVEDGTIAPSDATAIMGYDWEKVVAARQRCASDLKKADLPESPANRGSGSAATPGDGPPGEAPGTNEGDTETSDQEGDRATVTA